MSDPIPVHEYTIPQKTWDIPWSFISTARAPRLPYRYPVVVRSGGAESIQVQLRNDEGQLTTAVIDCADVDMFASALQAAAAQSRIVHMLNNPPEDEVEE